MPARPSPAQASSSGHICVLSCACRCPRPCYAPASFCNFFVTVTGHQQRGELMKQFPTLLICYRTISPKRSPRRRAAIESRRQWRPGLRGPLDISFRVKPPDHPEPHEIQHRERYRKQAKETAAGQQPRQARVQCTAVRLLRSVLIHHRRPHRHVFPAVHPRHLHHQASFLPVMLYSLMCRSAGAPAPLTLCNKQSVHTQQACTYPTACCRFC